MKTIAVSDATHRELVARKNDEGAANLDVVLQGLLGGRKPSDLLRRHHATVARLARAHGLARLRLFGSSAAGTDSAASDLDLLVDFRGANDLLDLVAFGDELGKALGCKIDGTTEAALHPKLRKQILAEAIEVWHA